MASRSSSNSHSRKNTGKAPTAPARNPPVAQVNRVVPAAPLPANPAPPVEEENMEEDSVEFVGALFDCILYERAYHRFHTLKKMRDFPVIYEEVAQDLAACYRLSLEPKFLNNPITAIFSRYFQRQKSLLTAKGLRRFAHDNMGTYDTFPISNTNSYGMNQGFLNEDIEVEDLDEEELSDFDEVGHGRQVTRKAVAYKGPQLSRDHEQDYARYYFAIYKHSQDMIAVMIDHLRRRMWYHQGSGGEVVPIKGMGVERPKLEPNLNRNENSLGGDNGDGDMDWRDRGIPDVKGVKKYTRRFNGKIKRRNFERNRARVVSEGRVFGQFHPSGIYGPEIFMRSTAPTDYSDSETEDQDPESVRRRAKDSQNIDNAISQLTCMTTMDYAAYKRPIRYLPLSHMDILYDWTGVNRELRLIDLPSEDAEPGFYAGVTKALMDKYRELLPPVDIMSRHKALANTLAKVLQTAFPSENLKVEPFGSFVSGLLLKDSDADFCITGPNIHEHELLNDMEQLGNVLRRFGMTDIVCIPSAMVPIVKFKDPQTNMECDLNTGNNLGTVNSELIKAYISIDERVKPFLYLIKAISKAQGINDSKTGYLSSYALTWMGIVYLQQLTLPESDHRSRASSTSVLVGGGGPSAGPRPWKPVLPKLQQQPAEHMTDFTLRLNSHSRSAANNTEGSKSTTATPSTLGDRVRCRFDENKTGRLKGFGHRNTRSLASLVIGFFEFYSRQFCFTDTSIVVATAEYVSKTAKEQQMDNNRFRIVDPFLHHRNITGTCRGETLARVWRTFDHCYRALSAGDVDKAWVPVE